MAPSSGPARRDRAHLRIELWFQSVGTVECSGAAVRSEGRTGRIEVVASCNDRRRCRADRLVLDFRDAQHPVITGRI